MEKSAIPILISKREGAQFPTYSSDQITSCRSRCEAIFSAAFEGSLGAHPHIRSTLIGRGERQMVAPLIPFLPMQIGWVVYDNR
jgi:hypothetical protein